MSDFVRKPLLKQLNSDNPMSRIENLEAGAGAGPSSFVQNINELSFNNTGTDYAIVGVNGNYRLVMSGTNLISELGIDAHFAGFDDEGVPQFWMSADTGKITGGAGVVEIGETGEVISGRDKALSFFSDMGSVSADRTLDIGMIRNGEFNTKGSISYYKPALTSTNLVTNPGFETGDFTGYTNSGAAIVTDDVYAGTYTAKFDSTDTLVATRVAIDTEKYYVTSIVAKASIITTAFNFNVIWYDAPTGGSIINSAPRQLRLQTAYRTYETILIPPAGATHAEISLGNLGGDVWVDNIAFQEQPIFQEMIIDDEGFFVRNRVGGLVRVGNVNTICAQSDLARSATTTPANDTELLFTGEPGVIYDVTVNAVFDGYAAPNTMDLLVGFSAPEGVYVIWGALGSETSQASWGAVATGTSKAQGLTKESTQAIGLGVFPTAPLNMISIKALVFMSSEAGPVAFKWSQNVSNANALVRLAGSSLVVTKLLQSTLYSYILQPNAADGVDTRISSAAPATNYGTAAVISIGESNAGVDTWRTLIYFDISGIPSTANVSSAYLELVLQGDFATNAPTIDAHRMKQSWGETSVTWNTYNGVNNWPGGAGAFNATDCDTAVILGSVSISAAEPLGTRITIPLDADEIEKFIDGTYTNNGFMLKTNGESQDLFNLYSSDEPTASPAVKPKLVVKYTLP